MKKSKYQWLIILFILSTSFTVWGFWKRDTQEEISAEEYTKIMNKMATAYDAPQIKADELIKLQREKRILLLDAREKAEFDISHLPYAKNIGFNDLKIDVLEKEIGNDQVVVVYCSVGYRSGKVAEQLKRRGFKAYNLYGGIFDWANTGRELVDREGRQTKKIHSYNKEWARLVKSKNGVY